MIPVGRERELERLVGLLGSARQGRGSMVWLVGEGGIGKTHLAEAVMTAGRAERMAAFSAAAEEFERHRPFAVIADCLRVREAEDERRARAAALLSSWAAEEPASPDALHLRAGGALELVCGEALVAAVEDLRARAPAVLVFEDLHWADQSSLNFVGRLVPRLPALGVLVLCTCRRLPRREDLERLLSASRERGATQIQVGALAEDAIEAVATELLGAPPGENLREQLAACGGNPQFVHCLLDALFVERRIVRTDGGVEVAKTDPPRSVDVAVLGWLSSLRHDAVDALRMASVLGASFSIADLSLLTGRPAAELWASLREALAAGAIIGRGEQLAFGHDVVREALYRDVPRAVRAGLHLDFARALAAAGGDPALVAEHLLRGARRGDREAVVWLHRAARKAAPRSAAVAAELLQAAYELSDEEDPMQGEVLAELGLNLVAAGRRQEGEEICRRALNEGAYPRGEGALRLTLARALVEQGRLGEGLAELEAASRSPGVTPAERAEAISWQVLGPLMAHALDAAEAAARAALEAAERAQSAPMVAFALTRLGHIAGFRGQFSEQERLAFQGLQLAERDGSPEAYHASHAHLNYAMALADSDRPHEGVATVAAGRKLYERLGMEETLRNSHHYAGYPLMLAGAWDDALVELETAVALSEESGLSWTVDQLAMRAVMLIRRDQLEESRELVERAERDLAAGAPQFRLGWSSWARAMLEEANGDRERATQTLWDGWTTATEAGCLSEQRTFAPELVRLLADTGDRERAEEVAGALETLASRNPGLRTLEALACRCRALVEHDLAGLMRACELYRGEARPHELALALEDAAVAVARTADGQQAVRIAVEALDRYASLGAARDAARTRGRLRAAGMRLGERGSRARPLTGWESLTASERRVAELAADGMSNPEIAERLVVSRHTVATHISHVLGKLSLRSRFELASARPEPTRTRS